MTEVHRLKEFLQLVGGVGIENELGHRWRSPLLELKDIVPFWLVCSNGFLVSARLVLGVCSRLL